MAILTGAIGAILGGVVAMIVQRLESTRQARIRLVRELYQQWQEPDMIRARNTAYNILEENNRTENPLSFFELSQLKLSGLTESQWSAISRVLHYFEQCGALAEIKALEMRSFKSLMGRYVDYWYENVIQPLVSISEQRDEPSELGWFTAVKSLHASLALIR